MTLKFEVTENVTEYLDKLDAHMETESKTILHNLGAILVEDYITPRIPKWNPNLVNSGEDTDYWKFSNKGGRHTLEILYTGMTDEAMDGDLEKGVWWEFGDQGTRTLKRDYAYFQETGIDPIALHIDAKNKWFVANSVWASKNQLLTIASKYMDDIMELEKIPKSIF